MVAAVLQCLQVVLVGLGEWGCDIGPDQDGFVAAKLPSCRSAQAKLQRSLRYGAGRAEWNANANYWRDSEELTYIFCILNALHIAWMRHCCSQSYSMSVCQFLATCGAKFHFFSICDIFSAEQPDFTTKHQGLTPWRYGRAHP